MHLLVVVFFAALAFGAGLFTGVLAFDSPFSELHDVEDALIEQRRDRGYDALEASCHEEPAAEHDYQCSLFESIDDNLPDSGGGNFAARVEDGKITFRSLDR